MSVDLQGRTFLVTGANSGIGRATVEELARRGADVVLASRSEEKTRPLIDALRRRGASGDLEYLKVDLGSLSSVRDAAQKFLDSGRKLDVLVNNAGIAATPGTTVDGFEITFGTNHLGPFLFTNLLLSRLKQSAEARIVNVASQAGDRIRKLHWDRMERPLKNPQHRLWMYGATKLMNVIHAKELARRLTGTSVTTYSLHPGVVATRVWRELPWPIEPFIKLFMISEEEGAKTTLYCATDPRLASESGRYYVKSREKKPNPLAEDPRIAAELFERSETMIARALK